MTTATKKAKGQKKTLPEMPLAWPKEGVARIDEAALFLRCSRSAIYGLIRDELLETVPLGRDKRVKWPSLWKYAESGDGRLSPAK